MSDPACSLSRMTTTDTAPATTPMTCSKCDKTVNSTTGKTPRGWRRAEDQLVCNGCWKDVNVVRAVTIPIAGPVDGTWEELREALKEAFKATTSISNWAVRQLAQAEPPRTAAQERMPAMSRIYLYPGARELAPSLTPSIVTAVLNNVEKRYKARRLHTYWFCKEALPTYRYPAPIPIPAGTEKSPVWRATETPDGKPAVSVLLGGRRWLLRLRGGKNYWRQLKEFDRLKNGQAKRGELVLIEQRANGGDHRPNGTGRKGGETRLMAKMVGWFPREPRKTMSGELSVRTDAEAFWVYTVNDQVFKYHAEHVRRWIVQHAVRRQRWSEDLKHEHRWPKPVRERMVHDHEAALAKHHNRMHSWVRTAAAMILGVAQRRRVGRVVYDDTVKSYAAMPWDALRTRLECVLQENGIEFVHASGGETSSPEHGAPDEPQNDTGAEE